MHLRGLQERRICTRVIPEEREGRGGWKDRERLLDRVWAGGAGVVEKSQKMVA